MSCGFVGLSSSPDTELKMYVGTFEILAYGLRYRGISAGLFRRNQKNRPLFRRQIWELGGKYCTPNLLAPLVDSELM